MFYSLWRIAFTTLPPIINTTLIEEWNKQKQRRFSPFLERKQSSVSGKQRLVLCRLAINRTVFLTLVQHVRVHSGICSCLKYSLWQWNSWLSLSTAYLIIFFLTVCLLSSFVVLLIWTPARCRLAYSSTAHTQLLSASQSEHSSWGQLLPSAPLSNGYVIHLKYS